MSSQAPIGTLHFVEEQAFKAQKALIAAKFNGLVLTPQKFDTVKEGKKPAFLAMNPIGKVPFLETDMGVIASSNSIARYVARCRADTSLYGKSFDDEGQIDTWMEFATYELEIPIAVWLYPVLGLMEQPPAAIVDSAKNDIKKALQVLEDALKKSEFLAGNYVSLADIVVVCSLKESFARLFDTAFRKPFAKVTAWFERCVALPQFAAVLGSVSLCKQTEKPQPVKAAFAAKAAAAKAPAKEESKKQGGDAKGKKEEPKKGDAKKAAAPAAAPAASGSASPEQEKAIKEVGDKIAALKTKLKGEGLSGKQINEHAEIKPLVEQLLALKSGKGAAPAPAAAAAPKAAAAPASGGSIADQVTAKGNQIRELKAKLKGEGLSGKKIDAHPDVAAAVAELQALKAQL